MSEIYRYQFASHVAVEDVESTLLLAYWGTESLHGETLVRLEADHLFDAGKRICLIDATTAVGRDLNRLFNGYARREFGDGFSVQRIDHMPAVQRAAAHS